MNLAIAMLGTSAIGEEQKFVIHPNEILSVCADDAEVEIVVCNRTTTAMPNRPERLPNVEFSFPIGPSVEMAKDMYIRSMSNTPGTVTIRLRCKDSKTAAAVAAFIEAQQTGGCNPPLPPNPDGPYA